MLVQVRQSEVLLESLRPLLLLECQVCVRKGACIGAGVQVDPWAAYLQQQRFLQQQAYGQTVGHRVFDGNQIPVPQSPSQTTNGSSSQNLSECTFCVPRFSGKTNGSVAADAWYEPVWCA